MDKEMIHRVAEALVFEILELDDKGIIHLQVGDNISSERLAKVAIEASQLPEEIERLQEELAKSEVIVVEFLATIKSMNEINQTLGAKAKEVTEELDLAHTKGFNAGMSRATEVVNEHMGIKPQITPI